MSKYKQRGAYHFREWKSQSTPYYYHMKDLLERITDFVPPQSKILDVGAGEGLLTKLLSDRAYDATGIDIDPIAVHLAEQLGVNVEMKRLESLFENDYRYEAILFCDVLEHCEYPMEMLDQASRMTDRLVICHPAADDPWAENDFTIQDFETFLLDRGWTPVHTARRHVRHVRFFKNTHSSLSGLRPAEDGGPPLENHDELPEGDSGATEGDHR